MTVYLVINRYVFPRKDLKRVFYHISIKLVTIIDINNWESHKKLKSKHIRRYKMSREIEKSRSKSRLREGGKERGT